jgi:hypothetical protein
LCFKVFEVESFEKDEDDVHYFQKLPFHLIRRTEDMGIVLRKTAHAGKSVEFAALFVTINRTEFGKPERKFLVRAGKSFVYFAVVRTVHRFEQKFFPFFRGMDRLK